LIKGKLAPYKVLILDEKGGASSWGQITKRELEEGGFEAIHKRDISEALTEIERDYYDILVVDLDLGGSEDGIAFQRRIREMGLTQPVLFVTGNEEYLNSRVFQYSDAFRRGPVLFFEKTSGGSLMEVVLEAANRVDPIRRSLFIMKKAGLGQREFRIGDHVFSVDQLLLPNPNTDSFVRSLRESLQELVMEIIL